MPTPNSPWDRLFNDIKINIPGVTDAVLQQELWRLVEDFLDQTNAWIEEIPFNILPNTTSYQVTPASKGGIQRLMMVYNPDMGPEKRWAQGGITFAMPDTINLMYAPSSPGVWKAIVSKNISDPAVNGYPDLDTFSWIIDMYRDALRFGTLGYLMMQPTKSYSNAKLGAYNWQNYVAERGRARTQILHANVYGGQRWQFPQGYATTARKGWT